MIGRKYKTVAMILAIYSTMSMNIVFASGLQSEDLKKESEFNKAMTQRAVERANVKESKLAGSDRYKTAVNVSKAGWSKSNKAILINGYALPDALTATPLAEEYNAPILLTEKDKLNNDTLTELKRLGVKEITLIGSDGVISKAQEDGLKSQGFVVERLGGSNRVDTSVKVAYKLKEIYAKKNSGQRKTVFIANGVKGLADATSVASPAGFKDAVILYTNGNNLDGIKRYIETSADDVYLVGGTGVISSGVENELKTTTNKRIIRLAGTDRKDTNAKVVNAFFPQANVNKMYIAKDGSGDEGQLVDALAVGSLAGREKNPVILSSGDLSASQKTLVGKKSVSEVVQVGDGANAKAFKQTVGIINGVAEPEPSDGMKLPTINWAKEQNEKYPYDSGGAYGGGASCSNGANKIEGDIYVKFGDVKKGLHTYGSKNQEQYNKVYNFVKDAFKSINFRYQPEWVYMQHYLNGGKADNFVDPILSQKGINTTYGQWKNSNAQVIKGITSNKLSKADAEKLAVYHSSVAHIESKINATQLSPDEDWKAWSAYQYVFEGLRGNDSSTQLRLLIGDMLGLNVAYAGNGIDDLGVCIQLGNYWWDSGKRLQLRVRETNPVLKSDSLFLYTNMVYEAPTYNMDSFYK